MNTGDIAPEIALATDADDRFVLSQHLGRKVVLFFYPQDDTETCTKEAIDFSEFAEAFAEADTIVVGISPDDENSHAKFRKKHKLAAVLAADLEHQAIDAYGVWQEKKTFGKTYMGVVRTTYLIGRDGRIAGKWVVTRVKGHAEAVLRAAQDLD